jgi:hypothetical protein
VVGVDADDRAERAMTARSVSRGYLAVPALARRQQERLEPARLAGACRVPPSR